MADPKKPESAEHRAEPLGFGEHARGLSAEYAHELGWQINEAERRRQASRPEDIDGGTDFDYGARDFGDEPVNTEIDPTTKEPIQNRNAGGTPPPTASKEHKRMKHAQQSNEEGKKHGDALEGAMKQSDEQKQGKSSAVPPAETGGHARSAAAHLKETTHLHDNEVDGGRGHLPPSQVNALREPPQEVSRIGKEHRKQ